MRTSLRSLAAAVSVAALLAGCSGEQSSPASGAGAPRDVLRFVVPGAPATSTYDPHGGFGNESDLLRFALSYDPLTVPGPDGRTRPRLATAWTPDSTLTRWRIALRTDATFSDGRPVRAADVLYSLRRIAAKSAENFGRLAVVDTARSRVIDEHTVELVTPKPYAELGRALESATFVVPEGADDFRRPGVGSGPYRLAGGDAGNAVLERNESWWGPDPAVRRIEVRAVADPRTRAEAVRSGQADVASSISPAAAREAEADPELQLVKRPAVTLYPFVMRLDTEPFDDQRVRRAVQLAADREELLRTVFLGYGQIGNDVLVPADPSAPRGLPQRTRDVAEARRLLAAAGHPDGLDLVLHTTTSYPGMDTAATLFARQLGDAGIRTKVVQAPPDTYFTEVFAKKPFYTGFFGGIPFTDVARVSLAADSPTNETAWRRPDWQARLDRALATADDADRTAQFGRLQADLRDQGGYVVWGAGEGLDLARADIRGLPTGPGFAKVFLDELRVSG